MKKLLASKSIFKKGNRMKNKKRKKPLSRIVPNDTVISKIPISVCAKMI